jgi:ribosomal-protein-alanine N-acetyltransferase
MRDIESARLLLEPMTVAHAAESLPFWQNLALYQFIPGGPPDSLAALEQRYAKLESRTSPAGDEHWLN